MWPYEQYEIPFMEQNLGKWRSEVDGCRKRMRLYLRLVYLSSAAIIVFALLAFVIRLATGAYWLPVILGGCMLPSAGLLIFSLLRWRSWESQADLFSQVVRPMEEELARAYNAQNVPMNQEG